MSAADLRGPYPLTRQSIVTAVPENCVGVYAFGEWTPLGGMWVKRIGHTTSSMREELTACLGRYALFQFLCCESAEDMYACECQLYHRFMPQEGHGHPVAPEDVTATCPVCGVRAS